MVFKIDWEKADTQNVLPRRIITKMIAATHLANKIRSYQIIPGGCANLNIKVLFEENEKPQILRLYLRDCEYAR